MTWVVAHANPIVVVMISDIRISICGAASTVEVAEFGVKKIHHVAPTVFAGFAGNIILGFRLIQDLSLYLEEAFDPNISTIALTEGWASLLPERIPPLLPSELAHVRADLIIAGMHLAPVKASSDTETEERKPYGSGCKVRVLDPATGNAAVERFSWSSAGVSVGSGAAVPEYQRMLAEVDWIQLSTWQDPAAVMTAIMNMTIESAPTLGISTDLTAMIMKYEPDNIVGSGLTRGAMASNRRLIAEDEAELRELWKAFAPPGTALTALGIGASLGACPPSASCETRTRTP